jgi:hypothetical protein
MQTPEEMKENMDKKVAKGVLTMETGHSKKQLKIKVQEER